MSLHRIWANSHQRSETLLIDRKDIQILALMRSGVPLLRKVFDAVVDIPRLIHKMTESQVKFQRKGWRNYIS
jgi:hypothetical protein